MVITTLHNGSVVRSISAALRVLEDVIAAPLGGQSCAVNDIIIPIEILQR